MRKDLGHYALLISVAVAVIAGFFPEAIASTAPFLLTLGIISGLLSLSMEKTKEFLIACAVLIITGTSAVNVIHLFDMGQFLAAIFTNVGIAVAPAAFIIALKDIWELRQEE